MKVYILHVVPRCGWRHVKTIPHCVDGLQAFCVCRITLWVAACDNHTTICCLASNLSKSYHALGGGMLQP